jgi:GntR family transcriptional regulator/MocR family aminotransferase
MAGSRTSSTLELLVPLDRTAPEPLHRQLAHALRSAIRGGRLEGGAPLPSSRALAGQLAVSRGIVVEAYEQLVAEGYLAATPGGATRVAAGAVEADRPVRPLAPAPYAFDFRPGRPDVTEFPRGAWVRSLRRALVSAPAERLTYLGGRGVPELRIALAAYLNRVRGTAADPADVVICSGFAQGVGLVARALAEAGGRRFAIEDPFDAEYRDIVRRGGLEPVPVPVDDEGIRTDLVEAAGVAGVLVTAAHQYPTGVVLSPDRRSALLGWARRTGGIVVEDDYDAEYRYDRAPIGALQGLAPASVVYAGSASKTLAPGLRLGWLVAPPALAERLIAVKEAADQGSPALDQLALADLLEHGEIDRHLRRMRPIYRRRRVALLDALARHLPRLEPVGASAGLHVLAYLPADLDEARLVRVATDAGVALSGLTPRRVAPGRPGVVFGYGTIPEASIEPGIARLAALVAEMAASVAS